MTKSRPVHPVAELFPLLPEDELQALADDIGVRGLLQPIVLDSEGRVLDGRNRLAACRVAKVEPTFETYDGDDPDGYALAVNIARRHLSKGQQAMVIARTEAVSEKPLSEIASAYEMSKSRIAYAKTVRDHAPDLVDAVVSGERPLNDAYAEAQRRKQAVDSNAKNIAKLRENASDLADLVVEERMTLGEAIGAWQERERKKAEERRDARSLLKRVVDLIGPGQADDGFVDSWADRLGDRDEELDDLARHSQQAAQILQKLADRIQP